MAKEPEEARRIAKDIGINVTGTLGILVEAKQCGLVKKLRPLLDKFIENEIRISKKLYQDILRLVNE